METLPFLLKLFEYFWKQLKQRLSSFKNRNKSFVEDYKNQPKKEFYESRKIENNTYGVFYNKNKEPLRIYKKPEHDNPKKLSKQYAKKLAWKKANGIN
ncbi:hypothetical protein KKF69_04365 [Patescibacteria group bacterium]|nr:hypothetical protein [Patescibacteria group bacterium]